MSSAPLGPAPPPSRGRARDRRRARRRRARALGGAVGILVIVVVLLLVLGGGRRHIAGAPPGGVARLARSTDPFAYATSGAAQFTERAAAGNSNALYVKSPGGVLATAARVAAFRPAIDRAVRGTGIDPALLEGLVFVESAGRPQVIAGTSVSDAAGLTQILAATATSLLGMHIDLSRSAALTRRVDAGATGQTLARLERQRAAADPRFDPTAALAATVRYLQDARRTFGREDLAFESYHMGIGNLTTVLRDYDVSGAAVPYVQLYFDVGPQRRTRAFDLLQSFGDDSSLYWWRIVGATEIMQAWRTDRAALRRDVTLQLADDAGATVLHPSAPRFSDPAALSAAYRRGALVPLPRNAAALGFSVDAGMGAGAPDGAPRSLYRGLEPVALHELELMAAEVRSLSGSRAGLHVASTVEDLTYERGLGVSDPLAATGWQFAIDRVYGSHAQAEAFQELLDRLQSLDLIRWVANGDVIDVTVAADAESWRG